MEVTPMRYVFTGRLFRWMRDQDIPPGCVDCTDMTDAEFAAFASDALSGDFEGSRKHPPIIPADRLKG